MAASRWPSLSVDRAAELERAIERVKGRYDLRCAARGASEKSLQALQQTAARAARLGESISEARTELGALPFDVDEFREQLAELERVAAARCAILKGMNGEGIGGDLKAQLAGSPSNRLVRDLTILAHKYLGIEPVVRKDTEGTLIDGPLTAFVNQALHEWHTFELDQGREGLFYDTAAIKSALQRTK